MDHRWVGMTVLRPLEFSLFPLLGQIASPLEAQALSEGPGSDDFSLSKGTSLGRGQPTQVDPLGKWFQDIARVLNQLTPGGIPFGKNHAITKQELLAEISSAKKLSFRFIDELLEPPEGAPSNGRQLSYGVRKDLKLRYEAALAAGDLPWLASWQEPAVLKELVQLSQMANVLREEARNLTGSDAVLAALQSAQIYSRLGIRERVEQSLHLTQAPLATLLPADQISLLMVVAQAYQDNGMVDQANAAFQRIRNLFENNPDSELKETAQLAAAFQLLNEGKLDRALRILRQLPASDEIQTMIKNTEAAEGHRRLSLGLQALEMVILSQVAALEEEGEGEKASVLQKAYQGQMEKIIPQMESGEIHTLNETLATLKKDQSLAKFFHATSAGRVFFNFSDRASALEINEEAFSKELLYLAQGLEQHDHYAAAQALSESLSQDRWVASEAKILLEDIPQEAELWGTLNTLKNLTLFFADSEKAAFREAGITVGTFGVARSIGVGAEFLFVNRTAKKLGMTAAQLMRNPSAALKHPNWFRFQGWGGAFFHGGYGIYPGGDDGPDLDHRQDGPLDLEEFRHPDRTYDGDLWHAALKRHGDATLKARLLGQEVGGHRPLVPPPLGHSGGDLYGIGLCQRGHREGFWPRGSRHPLDLSTLRLGGDGCPDDLGG